MTVEMASSHSRTISSLDPRSSTPTPQPPDLSGDGEIRDDSTTSSEMVASDAMLSHHAPTPVKASPPAVFPGNAMNMPTATQALLTADDEFVNAHLRMCPPDILKAADTPTTRNLVAKIRKANNQDVQYGPACSLLTTMSQEIWKVIKSQSQDNLERLHLAQYDSPMQFVDHHSRAPTHYPFEDVVDRPDVVGVFPPSGNPRYKWDVTSSANPNIGIPHYRLEAMVEIEDDSKDTPSRIGNYAFDHLRARPDHPGVYCLSIKQEFSWDDLEILAAFVYSIYDPPAKHILRDPSIQWEPSDPTDPCSAPVWKIRISDQEYCHGRMIFGGDPWHRRTTVFECNWPTSGFCVIMKDCYQQLIKRYDEWELVREIHADGFVPGVVRFAESENVEYEGEPMIIEEGDDARIRRRYLMLDRGEKLLKAKSVNDLLKAVYDVLEVSRVLALERKILHRDMSIHNILMYPKWGKFANSRFIESRPPLIDDVLAGRLRDPEEYQANCVLIDFDNGAKIEPGKESYAELACRTGTPTYISRAASIGRIWLPYCMKFLPMPHLTEDARTLYEALHGHKRYEQFEDKDGNCHGGVPPQEEPEEVPDVYYHRLEYDAESVYWTLITACLRVMPKQEVETRLTNIALKRRWKYLREHVIEENTNVGVIDYREDVGKMLYDIAKHVFPSYPLMEIPPPHPEHLHEAMQRLILNYLVAHLNDDIQLDPDNLRFTEGPEDEYEPPKEPAGSATSNIQSKKRPRDSEDSDQRQLKRCKASKEHGLPTHAIAGYPYSFGTRT